MLDGARTAAHWCHGAVGIGLVHLDLEFKTYSLIGNSCVGRRRNLAAGLRLELLRVQGDLGALGIAGPSLIPISSTFFI